MFDILKNAIYPLDDEKDLKLDFSREKALIADLEELNVDAPYWIPDLDLVKVVKVYDGDSLHVIGTPKNGDGNLYKFVVRLNNIDTPELRSKNPQEHEAALKSKCKLEDLIENRVVRLKNLSKDKFGRLLCDIFRYDESKCDFTQDVAKILIDLKMGYEYHGGKKKEFTS